MRISDWSSDVCASDLPSVEKPKSARFSQAASIVEISVSVMSRPLVLQYIRQKRRKIVRLIIDEIGMRIHIARLRPIIHPYCCHSDGFGRLQVARHIFEKQACAWIDCVALA